MHSFIKNNPLLFFIVTCLLIFLANYLLHAPFLLADADLKMGTGSRGAWTDEGLNTSQIRNYLNHGAFNVLECDNFLKTPLFSILLIIPFKIFGTHLIVARLTVLFLSFIPIAILLKQKTFQLTAFLLLITTLLFSPIFQYTHLAVPEMCATITTLLGGILFSKTAHNKSIYAVGVILLLAVLFKIQFVYVLMIPALAYLFINLINRKKGFNQQSGHAVIMFIACITIIVVVWYLPFKEQFKSIWSSQSGNFSVSSISFGYFKENIKTYFLAKRNFIFTISFIISLVIGFKHLYQQQYLPQTKKLLLFSIAWFLVELHKLPMDYLPIRYMISLYFSMGVIIAIVFAEVLQNKQTKLKIGVLILLVGLISLNTTTYIQELKNRTFKIYNLNLYFVNKALKNKVIIGSWATALTWESQSKTYPVWKELLNNQNPIEKFKPHIVIAEPTEDDSNKAYHHADVNLVEISDSVKTINIAFWDINIYWVREKNNK